MPNLPQTVRDFAEETLRLAASIEKAQAIQWEAAPIPRPSDDTTERAKGGHGDPTGSIALDDRRQAVREQHDAAVASLGVALAAARSARRSLDAAIGAWEGDTPPVR
ncbi:putative transcriptional regulator [Arthrobacter phage SWEP2]|uniref:Transcriptional regulator n=1 Tax=Arthrobacter phage SWEP2 TaxID=2945958 RepID=A0A9E7MIT1_9CAUD|nr:putative transcriptional regulator [Arthrobacter phage SWEP2]